MMSTSTTKDFGPIAGDYTFFEDHSTEARQDLIGYAATLESTSAGRWERGAVRMLDFGSGPGTFTAAFLKLLACPPTALSLVVVEPVDAYRNQAVNGLAEFTARPIQGFATVEACHENHLDLVLANHVFYYVPDLEGTLSALLAKLAPGGVFMTSIAGFDNTLIQLWQACFAMLGKPIPYNTSEDVQRTFSKLGVATTMQKIQYRLEFSDTTENRARILRFLLGNYLEELPLQRVVALFDPYVTNRGLVSMSIQHDQLCVVKSNRPDSA